jgi:ankyrin repeat protein
LTQDKKTPLHCLGSPNITPDHLQVAEMLLYCKASLRAVDKEGQTPLHCAAATKGSLQVCELFLNQKAEVDAPTKVPIYFYHLPFVVLTARFGVQRGWTPLHMAAKAGNCEVMELLLNRGARVDQCTTVS